MYESHKRDDGEKKDLLLVCVNPVVNPPDGEDRFLMRIALSSSIRFHGAKRSSLHLAVILSLSHVKRKRTNFLDDKKRIDKSKKTIKKREITSVSILLDGFFLSSTLISSVSLHNRRNNKSEKVGQQKKGPNETQTSKRSLSQSIKVPPPTTHHEKKREPTTTW